MDLETSRSGEFIPILSDVTSRLSEGREFRFRIKTALGIIGDRTQARRVYVALDEPLGHKAEVAFEWLKPGISLQNTLQKVVYAQAPSFKTLLLKDGYIAAEDAGKIPEDLADTLKQGEIQSWIALPLLVNGKHSGFLGLEDCRNEKVFEKSSSEFFRVLARIISGALQQNNYFAELESFRLNFQSYSDALDDIVIITDLKGVILYANDAVTRKLKYSPGEIRFMQIAGLFPEAGQEEALRAISGISGYKKEFSVFELQGKFGALFPYEAKFWRGIWNGQQCVFGRLRDLTGEQQDNIKFKHVFEFNPEPMSLNDLEKNTFLDVNEAFLKKTKYSREEVIGKTPVELGLFPEWHKSLDAAKTLAAKGAFSGFTMDVCDKNGDYIHGLFSGTIIEMAGKKAAVILMVDITERDALHKRMQEQNQKLQAVLESSKIGTWTWDIQTGETTIDKRIAEMLGYEMSELSPEFPLPEWETIMVTDLTRFLHPEDAPLSREVLQRHFRKEAEFYSCDFRMKHKNGSWIWVQNRGKVSDWTADGKPHIMHGTYADITERKEAALSSEYNEKRLAAMLSCIPDVMSIVDGTGKLKYVSSNYKQLFGWEQKDLTGRMAWELVHQDDLERIQTEFKNHLKTPGSVNVTTFRFKRGDGSYRHVELTTKNLLHDPAVAGMVLSGHEIKDKFTK